MKKIQHYRRLVTLWIGVLIAALLFGFVTGLPVQASFACQSNGGAFFFEGYLDYGIPGQSPNAILVSSNIDSHQPQTCGNGFVSYSFIWVMLTASWPNDGCEFAQSGYLKPNSTQLTIKTFTQWGQNCNNVPPPVLHGTAAPGNHLYQVRYNSGKHKINMWIDNVRIASTNFDPALPRPNGWGAQPWGRQYLAETHDIGDDIPGTAPGTPDGPAVFSTMQYQSCNGCAWLAPAGLTYRHDHGRYHSSRPNNSTLRVWTDPIQ